MLGLPLRTDLETGQLPSEVRFETALPAARRTRSAQRGTGCGRRASHTQGAEEGTSLDDQPARSYATRAKLVASGPADPEVWSQLPHGFVSTTSVARSSGHQHRATAGGLHLLHSNAGSSSRRRFRHTSAGPHLKPYPDEREPNCPGPAIDQRVGLGTDFISDVLLISLRVDRRSRSAPGLLATRCRAPHARRGTDHTPRPQRLEIEPGEVQAEYRPALTHGGHEVLRRRSTSTTPWRVEPASLDASEILAIVFEDAIHLLEDCPAGATALATAVFGASRTASSTTCSTDTLAASLLGICPTKSRLAKARLEQAADRLFEDLAVKAITRTLSSSQCRGGDSGIGTVRHRSSPRSSGLELHHRYPRSADTRPPCRRSAPGCEGVRQRRSGQAHR